MTTPSATFFRLGFLFAVLLSSAGCIKVEQILTLDKEGGGRFEINYSIPEQTVSHMAAMARLRERMASAGGAPATAPTKEETFERLFLDPSESQIRQALKPYEQNGIIVEAIKVEPQNDSRHVHLQVKFASLARAAQADVFPEHGFSLSRNSRGNYVFYRVPENADDGETHPQPSAEDAKLLSPILGGFKVSLKVKTPGRVIDTNANRKDLYSAAWIFDFDKDPDAVALLHSRHLRVEFDGSGLSLPEVKQAGTPAPARETTGKAGMKK